MHNLKRLQLKHSLFDTNKLSFPLTLNHLLFISLSKPFKFYETIIQFSPRRRLNLGKLSHFAGQEKPPPLCSR
jgi:hypothetical protein